MPRTKPVQKPPIQKPARLQLDRADILKALVLTLLTFLAYSPAILGRIVWDDAGHITAANLQSLHGLYRIWFQPGATQQYYPLLHTAFWLEHRLFGDALAGYHLINIALHLISAFLIVAIARQMKIPGGWLAAFLFALHPVATESVAWISEQKNTLSTVFYLGAALLYLRFDSNRKRSSYILALILFLMALMSKTVTVTLPVTLLIAIWWQRGTLSVKRDLYPLAPWIAIGISGGAVTSWVERVYEGARGNEFALSLFERCLLAGRIAAFYLGKLLWPAGLTFFYPHWKVDASEAWQYTFPLAILLLIAAGWIYARRKNDAAHRAPLAALLAFLVAIGPAMGFINAWSFVYSYVADHFQYLGMIPVFLALAAGATVAARAFNMTPQWTYVAAAVASVILGALTWQQSHIYLDEQTLYRDAIARNPQSWVAYLDLALVVDRTKGHEPEALALTRKAIDIEPQSALGWINHGAFLYDTGHLNEALQDWRKAVQLEPEMPSAHTALGDGLAATDSLPQAVSEYQTAIRMNQSDWRPHLGLAKILSQDRTNLTAALAEFRKALELGGDSPELHVKFADALSQTPGSINEAIEEYRTALQLSPDDARAHLALGAALLNTATGHDAAIAEFHEALRIDPHYAEAHYDLGTVLSDIPGQSDAAIAEYEAALRDKPDFAAAHLNLGIALEDIPGRRADAIAQLRSAVESDPNRPDAHYELAMAVLESHGNIAEAIDNLRAAVKLKPDFKEARDALTNLHAALGT